MKSTYLHGLNGVLILLFCGLFTQLYGIDTLRVGFREFAPYVMKDPSGHLSGISIEIWERIAQEKNIHFHYQEYYDDISLLKMLEYDEIDLTINPMIVNESRLNKFEVSQPFFITNTTVAIPYISNNPIMSVIRNLFSFAFLKIVIGLSFTIFIFGFLLWLVERKKNNFQFRSGWLGLIDGLWWSAVTMTTVGYGDKTPKSIPGKAIAVIWMFTAVIIISSFTASIASIITLSSLQTEIEEVADLRQIKSIAMIDDCNCAHVFEQKNIDISKVYSYPIEGINGLIDNEIEVLLYDRTLLQYYIKSLSLDEEIKLLPIEIEEHYLSFLMTKNNPNIDKINAGLIRVIHSDEYETLRSKFEY